MDTVDSAEIQVGLGDRITRVVEQAEKHLRENGTDSLTVGNYRLDRELESGHDPKIKYTWSLLGTGAPINPQVTLYLHKDGIGGVLMNSGPDDWKLGNVSHRRGGLTKSDGSFLTKRSEATFFDLYRNPDGDFEYGVTVSGAKPLSGRVSEAEVGIHPQIVRLVAKAVTTAESVDRSLNLTN